jgi:hypothetical protein
MIPTLRQLPAIKGWIDDTQRGRRINDGGTRVVVLDGWRSTRQTCTSGRMNGRSLLPPSQTSTSASLSAARRVPRAGRTPRVLRWYSGGTPGRLAWQSAGRVVLPERRRASDVARRWSEPSFQALAVRVSSNCQHASGPGASFWSSCLSNAKSCLMFSAISSR